MNQYHHLRHLHYPQVILVIIVILIFFSFFICLHRWANILLPIISTLVSRVKLAHQNHHHLSSIIIIVILRTSAAPISNINLTVDSSLPPLPHLPHIASTLTGGTGLKQINRLKSTKFPFANLVQCPWLKANSTKDNENCWQETMKLYTLEDMQPQWQNLSVVTTF